MKTINEMTPKLPCVFLLALLVTGVGAHFVSFHLLAVESQTGTADEKLKPSEPKAATREKTITIWKELRTLSGHGSPVWCVAFSPDGKLLASGTGGYLGQAGELKIWEPLGGREIVSAATPRSVRWVSFAPDGKTLATAEHEDKGAARLRETATGKVIHTLVGHQAPTDTVAFSADGQLVATASWDKTVIIWDTKTGNELKRLEGHTGEAYPVAFSPVGRLVLSGDGDGVAILWDADTGKQLRTLRGHVKAVQGVAFSKDGKTLATAGWDKTVKLWNAATGEELVTLKGHDFPVLDVTFSPDGKTLASVSGRWGSDEEEEVKASSGEVILWDFHARKAIVTLRGHTERIFGVSFSADGKLLATASWDKTVKIWRGFSARPALAQLAAKDLGNLWEQMAGNDPSKTSAAVEILAGAPEQALPFLAERLRAVKPAENEKRIAKLISQLDDDDFSVREKATLDLTNLGPEASPQLRMALDKNSAAEVKHRIGQVLEKLKMSELTTEQKRGQLAIMSIELMGTPQARKMLGEFARERSGSWLAQEANVSLIRQGKNKD